ncbi:hypothetical protein U1Q18_002594 [Sarracenia purpurea var. burkii]
MVGGTQPPHQSQQPQPPTATAQPTPSSAEEEALKRNTDCVYFLASPLTCKKGAECEYRHSDIARVNPRDCWFWLNGSCLNPKCAFRHPPLDGLLGTQVSTPVGSSLPPSQTTAVTSAPRNSGKQAVPCIFFQKGFCLKGDICPFLHAPITVNNKVPQRPPATTVSEPPILKKAFSSLEKCTQEQKKALQANIAESTNVLSRAIPQTKVETGPSKNGLSVDRYLPPPPPSSGLDDQLPRTRPTNGPSPTMENLMSRSNRMQQIHVPDDRDILNSSRDADEFSREPSPGFDVLVDDELRDSDYYHNEEHYGRIRNHEKRNLNPVNDYDIGHSADYDSMVDVDRDKYRDPRGYDSYERLPGQYAREQRRSSSERMGVGSAHIERRRYPRGNSPDQIVEADLRHHLSNQRRVNNGLRSVISHDRPRDNHVEDRSYRGPSRRDSHRLSPNDSSVTNRLRGRIKLPGRSSSPVNGSDLNPEREMDRGRNWGGRLSPGRSQASSIHQGRLRDRIKVKVQEDINDGRSSRGGLRSREIINDNDTDFSGPKSLAELKGGKNDQQSLYLGKRKFPKLENRRQSENDLSFEGPKPLSEILKRKRVAETTVPGSDLIPGNTEDINQKEQPNLPVHINKEETKSEGRDGLVLTPREETVGESRLHPNARELDTEEGMIVGDPMEDHEPENFDHRERESDYEQIEGEDHNLDESENPEAEEEYLDDDDDGDDFAKKIGVMFS